MTTEGSSGAPFRELRNPSGERLDFAFHEASAGDAGSGGTAARRSVVILAHGVTSNKDRPWLVALSEALAAAGIASLRFSFAGNGASEGRFEDATLTKEVTDLGSVLDALAAASVERVAYVGHSMGAAIGVMHAASRARRASDARDGRDDRIRALVSLAGMVHVASFFTRHFGDLAFGAPMLGKPASPWNRALADDAARIGSLAPPAARIEIPWLLVHGAADELVPLQDSHDARAAAANRPDLVTLPGVDHRFTGAIPSMVAAVVQWLQRRLAG